MIKKNDFIGFFRYFSAIMTILMYLILFYSYLYYFEVFYIILLYFNDILYPDLI